MPQVGKKHYSYTKRGMAAAKKESAKSGKKMTYYKPKKSGTKSRTRGK